VGKAAAEGFEIFMLRRTSKAAFAGGMYVFPGGRVDPEDHFNKYGDVCTGPSAEQTPQARALGSDHRGYWVAGIRESFEEAGLLLAYDSAGNYLSFDDTASASRFAAMRDPLHAGELSLHDICEAENLTLAVDRIHYYNRVVTPAGRPRRFDTRFFIAEAPAGQTGEHDDIETVDSVWITPQDALASYADGEFGLMRITEMQLSEMAQHPTMDAPLALAGSRQQWPVSRPVLPRN
jgi:8-oxo-dGTP pyrophosphatase MutT (NUDIX family)